MSKKNEGIVVSGGKVEAEQLAVGKNASITNVSPNSARRVAPPSTRILFLASNPSDTGRLRLDNEIREVEEGLRRANHRDKFELVTRFAVRPKDLSRAMLDEKPSIVHFSGHGTRLGYAAADAPATGGIVLENMSGGAAIVPAHILAKLMEPFKSGIDCVFLNACYSESQAEALLQYVPYVIGMNAAVSDDAAICLATGFYDALGAGANTEDAFNIAVNRIELEALGGANVPVLRKQGEGLC